MIYILGQLSDTDVDWLARNGRREKLAKGTMLIQAGTRIDHLYIVLDGKMRVLAPNGVALGEVSSGDILGELAFVDAGMTTASILVDEDAKVLALPTALVSRKIAEDLPFSARFHRALAIFLVDRMRNTMHRLGVAGPAGVDLADGAAQDDVDELDGQLLDNLHLAGARFRSHAQGAGRVSRVRGTLWVAVVAGGLLASARTLAQPIAPSPLAPTLTLAEVLRQTLAQNPHLLLSQQQVQSARASVLEAQGGFDAVTELSANRSRRRDPLTAADLAEWAQLGADKLASHDSSQVTSCLSVQKLLANGLTLGSDYTVQRNYDTLQALQGGTSALPQSTGRLSFTIQVPLLRNAGRDVIGVAAEAAASDLSATLAGLEFASGQVALAATLYYWDLAARQRNLDLAQEGEGRSRRLLEELRKLAAADEIPQADLELMLAIGAGRTAARIAAEQALNSSRTTLARHLGLDGPQALGQALPAMPLPRPDPQASQTAKLLAEQVLDALARRADLRAAESREQSARLLLNAARHNLKPLAQLNAGISHGGLAYGASSTQLIRPYTSRLTGPSFNLGVQLQWPVDNRQATGAFLSRSAEAVSAEIARRDLRAAIGSGIQLAASALDASVRQLDLAGTAVRHYAKSLANEQVKRRMGASTLIDVLNVEDRLEAAQQAEIQARLTYASAIAQLLFESGRLIRKRSDNQFEVPVDALLTLNLESAGLAAE